ncbi:MAG: hypothetical protein J5965_13870 [Aeriscardovia sp.]|nr:hypothetical protein [Aeriscardovia sp.]
MATDLIIRSEKISTKKMMVEAERFPTQGLINGREEIIPRVPEITHLMNRMKRKMRWNTPMREHANILE